MSATTLELRWSVVAEDSDHWTPASIEACERDDPASEADWVVDGLREAMQKAGNAYIEANPDLFRGELV